MIGVTGANGLLGSFIVRKLIEEGKPFVAFKRRDSDVSLLDDVSNLIQWREFDLLDPISTDEALQGLEAVIHAAALVSFDPRKANLLTRVNVEGTRNVVNACLANDIGRLIHISSVAALGRMKEQSRVDETNKWIENGQHTSYATSKYRAELEVFRGQQEGLRTVILNPSVILGPGDWARSSARLFKYVWDERLFYIDGSLNYVDVRDVAALAWQLYKSGTENERFIANAGAVTFKAFFDAVASRYGRKPPSIKLNRKFVSIVARTEAWIARIRRSEPLIGRETARLANTHYEYRNEKVKNALSYEFRSLDDTLDWCCQYYMEKIGAKKA